MYYFSSKIQKNTCYKSLVNKNHRKIILITGYRNITVVLLEFHHLSAGKNTEIQVKSYDSII